MAVVGIPQDDVVGAAGRGGLGLVRVAGQHRHRALAGTAREGGQGGQPDDAGTDDEHRSAVLGHGAHQPVTGDGDGLVEAGATVGDRIGHGVDHRLVRQHLLGPTAAEVLGVAERTPGADHAAVQVETRGRPPAGTVGARRIDPPGQAGYARVEDHPGPDGHGAVGTGLDDAAGRLVPEHEGEGTDGGQGGRGPRVVGEEVEVATADPAGRHGNPRP